MKHKLTLFTFCVVSLLLNCICSPIHAATPSVAIDSVTFMGNLMRVSFTPYDVDGDSIAVTDCQYSLDNVTWINISSAAIRNNTAKVNGQQSYIDWVTTATFTSSLTDNSVWFRMKAVNGGYGTFVISTVTIPVSVYGHGTIIDNINGYLYILGGDIGPSEATKNIYCAKINNSGSINTFTTSSVQLPADLRMHGHQAIGYNGYAYVIGGSMGGSCSNVIHYAKMNSSGTLNSFVSSTNTLPVGLSGMGCVQNNGYLYILGGIAQTYSVNTVYYTKINNDGSIGPIITSTNTLPATFGFNDAVVWNGYIYSIGGGSEVYYAKLNNDGSVGSFTVASSTLPYGITYEIVVGDEGYMFLVGGCSSVYLDTIYYSKFNVDGSISEFKLSDKTLPTTLSVHGVATFNNRFYVTAGGTAYKAYTNKVRYCELPNISDSYYTSSSFAVDTYTPVPPVKRDWWDNAWNDRLVVTISNSSGTLTDYQVYLSTNNVAIDLLRAQNKVQADVDDIRFVNNTNTTMYNYWIDSDTSNIKGFWIKVSELPAAQNTTFYMYYNNPAAIAMSSGPATFEFYDDFNEYPNGSTAPSKWDVNQGWSVNSGVFKQTLSNYTPPYAIIKNLILRDFALDCICRWDGPNNENLAINFRIQTPSPSCNYSYRASLAGLGGSIYELLKITNNCWSPSPSFITSPYTATQNKWMNVGVEVVGRSMSAYFDNLKISAVDNSSVYYSTGYVSFFCAVSQWSIDNIRIRKLVYPEPVVSIVAVPTYVWDGTGQDSDTTYSTHTLSANWASVSDPESNIAKYWYAIGTTARSTNIASWTDIGLSTFVVKIGLSLTYDTTYYFSIKAENSIGMLSNPTVSDGIYLQNAMPVLAINSVAVSSGTIRINYTTYDTNGYNIITSNWQYSKDGMNWADINADAILNNSYKPSGMSYINWVASQTIAYANNQAMFFRMKAMDCNSLGYASSFSTLTYTLPAGLVHYGFTKYNDTAYLLGGVTNSTPSESESSVYSNKIYTAKLNTDGTFQTGFSLSTATLPIPRYSLKTSAYNGYLYAIGGGSNTSRLIDDVCYLRIGNTGMLTSVNVSTNTAPTIKAGGFAICIYNNYLYFIGGYNTPSSTMYDTVYYATIKTNGDISSFTLLPTKMPVKLFEHSVLAYNGYLYIVGGHLGNAQDSNKIYYAKINDDGSIGSFSTNVNSLPINISMLSCFLSNGYLYITGGHNYSTSYDCVYYAKLQPDGSVGTITLSPQSIIPKATASHHTLTTDTGFYIIGGMNSRGYSRNDFSDVSNNIYYSRFTFMTSTYSVSPVFTVDIPDNTPPEKVEYVNDGVSTDVEVWYSTNSLSANWAKANDSESCVAKYWYAVGTSSGETDVVSWTDVGLSTYVVKTGLSLSYTTTYYVSIKAENNAGLIGDITSSDGMCVIDVSIDKTPPSIPEYVWDGTSYDIDITLSTTTLYANFGRSYDNETGITNYLYSIGTVIGSTNVVNWTDIGYSTYVVTSGFTLSVGTTYYFNLRSVNNAGLQSGTRISDGICVIVQTSTHAVLDTIPPFNPEITSNTHPKHDVAYANTTAIFTLNISTPDASGIASYYYLVNGSSYTLVTPENGTNVDWTTITLATLADGIWYIHTMAIDSAGNWSAKNTTHYKFIVHLTIDPSQDVALVYSDGLKIDIPAGTLTNSTKVDVTRPNIVNLPRITSDPKLKDTTIAVEIRLADGTHELGNDITITIPYTDEDIVGLDENNLKLFYYNEVNKGWVLIPASSVDKVNKKIIAKVNHLTTFKVMEFTSATEEIESLSNYPNPFKPVAPYTKIHYVLKTDADVDIRIYDLTGELVWQNKIVAGSSAGGSAGPNDVTWDGKNGIGSVVDTGAYICIVQCKGVKLKTKIGVKQ